MFVLSRTARGRLWLQRYTADFKLFPGFQSCYKNFEVLTGDLRRKCFFWKLSIYYNHPALSRSENHGCFRWQTFFSFQLYGGLGFSLIMSRWPNVKLILTELSYDCLALTIIWENITPNRQTANSKFFDVFLKNMRSNCVHAMPIRLVALLRSSAVERKNLVISGWMISTCNCCIKHIFCLVGH